MLRKYKMLKQINLIVLLSIFIGGYNLLNAQSPNTAIGSFGALKDLKASVFDLSDPKAVNIKVSVWGAVKNPGQYIVPDYTNVTELLTYSGGPIDISKLEELRIYRFEGDTTKPLLLVFNYNDLLWGNKIKTITFPPKLLAGDILIVPYGTNFVLKDYISFGISGIAAVFSILSIILQITR